MEKTIWEILHLDTPTSNIDEIKKAYSKQSKKCNPEENPEEFRILYNAYKVALSYARHQNYEKEYQHINSEIDTKEPENDFGELFKEEITIKNKEKTIDNKNELINSFKDIIESDKEQFDEIQQMLSNIDEKITNPDELEKVVESEEFYDLMKIYDFQVNLSMYLNNRPDSKDPNYIIYLACKKFFKENPDIIPLESLLIYFEPFIRTRQNNYNAKSQNRASRFFYVIISVVVLSWNLANLFIFNNSNNSEKFEYSYEKELTTSNNEILTYEYDKEQDKIVSNDDDYKISYNIPNKYELKDTFMNSDYGKYYENSDEIEINIATDPSSVEEYYQYWKELDGGELNKVTIKNRLFYYIRFPRMIDEEQIGTNLIFWTEISDKDILLISTQVDIEVNSFIEIIEEIIPLNINSKKHK